MNEQMNENRNENTNETVEGTVHTENSRPAEERSAASDQTQNFTDKENSNYTPDPAAYVKANAVTGNPPEHHTAELVSMILGIISFVTSGCCCINVILSIVSIVFAFRAKKLACDHRFGGMSLTGLILSIISIVMTLLILAFVVLMILLDMWMFSGFFEYPTLY